ncbi:HypC/HybG/HupF family hydrogenase formation chaperone [Bacteroidota bacterium]
MCLSIPAEVKSIKGDFATVSIGGVEYEASLKLVIDVKVGDYILMHTGFAIQKLDPEEAKSTLELFRELDEINRNLDEEDKE